MIRSEELVSEADNRAQSGQYYTAIEIYSQAITLYPHDYSVYLSRAYCYLKSELYHLALIDSDEAIRLAPRVERCHLDKARALAGMREYVRAQDVYLQVLNANANSSDAKRELIELIGRALIDIGFDKQTARKASQSYQSIRAAIDGLLSERVFKNDISIISINNSTAEDMITDIELNNSFNELNNSQIVDTNDYIINDSNCDMNYTNGTESGVKYADKARNWAKCDIKPDANVIPVLNNSPKSVNKCEKPTNIWGYNGLRVQNINSDNKRNIMKRFGAFGKVTHVEPVAKSKSSVWIYYSNPVSPVDAIAKLQNTIHSDINYYQKGRALPLRIFFAPTDEQMELRFSRPKQPLDPKGECYYWRTTTCLLGPKCAYIHIACNKQIDAQIWMKDRDGKAI